MKRRAARRLVPVLFLLLMPLSRADERVEIAVQNQTLREYFRDLEREKIRLSRPPSQQPYLSGDLVPEEKIDRMARVFAKGLVKKRDHLTIRLNELQAVWQDFAEARDDIRPSLATKWGLALKNLQQAAQSLHSTLRPVLIRLQSKPDSLPKLRSDPDLLPYEAEKDFLVTEVSNAQRQMDDFFFAPRHSVTLEGLRSGDILLSLYRAAKFCEELRKEVER